MDEDDRHVGHGSSVKGRRPHSCACQKILSDDARDAQAAGRFRNAHAWVGGWVGGWVGRGGRGGGVGADNGLDLGEASEC